MRLSIAQIAQYCNAQLLIKSPDDSRVVTQVSWDTRSMTSGAFYIAFAGEHTDGNNFLITAMENGAVAILAGRPPTQAEYELAAKKGVAVLQSDDTLVSFQELARSYRTMLDDGSAITDSVLADELTVASESPAFVIPAALTTKGVITIGITGSSGKTTTKDLVSAVMSTTFVTTANQGNHNNEIGLPVTILSAEVSGVNKTEVLITEMGMQGKGEIELLAQIARPHIGIITNIGVAHCELLGSRENIARAKAELICALPEHTGIAILNGDDAFTPFIREVADTFERDIKVMLFGLGAHNDIRATNISYDSQGRATFDLWLPDGRPYTVKLSLAGEHNVLNALAACACGVACGIAPNKMQESLACANASAMRQEILQTQNGTTLINDTYNANPDSMRAALSLLSQLEKASGTPNTRKHIAILGDMYELGVEEEAFHREVGAFAHINGLDVLIVVGKLGAYIAAGARDAGMAEADIFVCENIKNALVALDGYLPEKPIVLVKASRGMQLEKLVDEVLSQC